MTTESEKQTSDMLNSLSKNVSELCHAIDPNYKYGPETSKLVEHQLLVRQMTRDLIGAIRLRARTNSDCALLLADAMALERLLE